MTILLALLYPIAVQYERESLPDWLRSVCKVFAGIALIIDVAANWTELSIAMWEWPRRGEWTFSTRLERMVLISGRRGNVARLIARVLNWFAPPGHPHIKNAA